MHGGARLRPAWLACPDRGNRGRRSDRRPGESWPGVPAVRPGHPADPGFDCPDQHVPVPGRNRHDVRRRPVSGNRQRAHGSRPGFAEDPRVRAQLGRVCPDHPDRRPAGRPRAARPGSARLVHHRVGDPGDPAPGGTGRRGCRLAAGPRAGHRRLALAANPRDRTAGRSDDLGRPVGGRGAGDGTRGAGIFGAGPPCDPSADARRRGSANRALAPGPGHVRADPCHDHGPAGPAVTVLALRGVRYRYAGATDWALDGIDLEVEAGEVVGITGANDAGKSTLCLVAAGLAPGSIGGKLEGSVLIGGTESRELAPHAAAQRCGILFQNAATQLTGTTVTVWEEVAFGPRNLGLDLDAIIERVEWALRLARVEHLAERQPDRLSGGQAQLVALASVLALRPTIVILDEPTSQLDPAGTRLVGETLAGLARDTGTALLIVEHKTDLLDGLCQRVLVVDEGRIVLGGPAAEVLEDRRLEGWGGEAPPRGRLAGAIRRRGLDPDVVLVSGAGR